MKQLKLLLCLLLTSCAVKETPHSPIKDNHSPPIYSGCEQYGKEQLKRCFQTKISQHIYKYSDTLKSYARDEKEPIKITVFFNIEKTGDVKVTSVKPEIMKQDIVDILKRLPPIKPAMHNNKPVTTPFRLPIKIILAD
ncbi:hypothetical protein [Phocoenobacter skyensis]|uniref:Protein TonB n=1 Tax=Phocoenobacter skyensis TaxID=97481 RepID=A0A1H7W5F9_9PAST|nr:hypothetical protein [Pasteurella skyensis]MDP8079101.1 hypothetical protein [Pasteurella skyensis]MDP8085051.1 hypothetical protein [Pasteurella skyensis]MDP8170636.1 hypothetical protein [Pasteurella skyensis]MDP8174793.1 hypothetical protein [Pasteurella skyensis]MDP8185049.1 hypothetical protein [Pasteurella skyensis]